MGVLRKYLFFLQCILPAAFFLLATSVSASQIQDNKHILFINSYHQRMPWVKDIVQGVEDVLLPEENNYTIHIENMDSKEFHSESYFAVFKEYLRVKYEDTDISLILSSDNNAYDFLLQHRDQLFPDVPVFFCGVNNFDNSQIAGKKNITGAVEVFSADTTLTLAKTLMPELDTVYVINDYLKTGRLWEKDIRQQLGNLDEDIEFEYSKNVSFSDLLEIVGTFQSNSAILLGAYFSDKEGNFYSYERVASKLSQASSVPVFCLVEFIIDEGMVGGQVISGYYQGRAMAEMAKQFMAGVTIDQLPVMKKGSNVAIFNHDQLQRYGLNQKNLPQNSDIINKPFSFYGEYRQQIWFVLSFIGILLVVIFLLIATIHSRRRAESALIRSEKRFRQLADSTWEALVIHDDGILLEANEMFTSLFGYTVSEVRGKQVIPLIYPEEYHDLIQEKLQDEDPGRYEVRAMTKEGGVFPVEVRARYIEYDGKEVRVAAIRDLTETKRMEEQLTQSRKLEAIGTLAGGIAHDFNNILSAIIGYAEILLLTKANEKEVSDKLENILHAGNRAKLLVEQILTFARKNEEKLQAIQLSQVLSEVLDLMRASLPSSIEIQETILSDGCVKGDMTKMSQVVMNLCTNGGKAMVDGGVLHVRLDEVVLDERDVADHHDVSTGQFLLLEIRDTGKGIAADNLDKIFDPFFTTEKKEKGTGLGLSVVHGVVKESHGFIDVKSSENDGTTFSVYLPLVECCEGRKKLSGEVHTLPEGKEKIMIIDDEEDLISIGVETLTTLGYTVEGFRDSQSAVAVFKKEPQQFDLVITDMTMPKMTGEQVAEEFLKVRPDIPIIMCSGYSETFQQSDAAAMGIKGFLVKPVPMKDLALTIRKALDGDG